MSFSDQPTDRINIGCDPKEFPTADYIQNNLPAYKNPFVSSFVESEFVADDSLAEILPSLAIWARSSRRTDSSSLVNLHHSCIYLISIISFFSLVSTHTH